MTSRTILMIYWLLLTFIRQRLHSLMVLNYLKPFTSRSLYFNLNFMAQLICCFQTQNNTVPTHRARQKSAKRSKYEHDAIKETSKPRRYSFVFYFPLFFATLPLIN